MSSQRWMLAACFSLASVFLTGRLVESHHEEICRTYGSGVVEPFVAKSFYVRSNCPFILTRFTHNRVECLITIRRDDSGLLVEVEITINNIRTVLRNGTILVEGQRVDISLPYDHTYQHIYPYGCYTKLRSSLLPLSVIWHDVPGGIDTMRVVLEQELSAEMIGLCGNNNNSLKQQLIRDSVLPDSQCQTRDVDSTISEVCAKFFSHSWECLKTSTMHYLDLCNDNIYEYEDQYIRCAFFREIIIRCGNESQLWSIWRSITNCEPPVCQGDLSYVERGPAFIPTCSIPHPDKFYDDQALVCSCTCPNGMLHNDRADGFKCVYPPNCPCVFDGKTYSPGETRSTKCQWCKCDSGKWQCSKNSCPTVCSIENQFVKTFDGKRYVLPGKCTYVASQGPNWKITIEFSQDKAIALKTVVFQLYEEKYTFSLNMVKIGNTVITDHHRTDHALVCWQSSIFIQIQTSFGMKIQVQVSPEIQLYITASRDEHGKLSGLCGNSNNDTTDDFTTSSGIIENSAQVFAMSWTVDVCSEQISTICTETNNELFAEENCSVLKSPYGIFAKCHGHIPTDHYYTACVQRTCNCGGKLQQCLCSALGNYAKACASLGVLVGDWRKVTNCPLQCENNQVFSYDMESCNNTCRSLFGRDPSGVIDDVPVEGCGCPEGTHLNGQQVCTSKGDCDCYFHGGRVPPGNHIIDGRICICEEGKLNCTDCGCTDGKVCVHCAQTPINTAQKTCESLFKPMDASCTSGCYCPEGLYEDHNGNCVRKERCTCMYGGKIFSTGEGAETLCKSCICDQGQWECKDKPCPGKCQVYGNGHYQTFDCKWYRFSGQCRYILVEDDCGNGDGTFSIIVESVPCCDDVLTCARTIIFTLKDKVTLTMSDMKVNIRYHSDWTLEDYALFSIYKVGLYIVILVPSKGITLIWDKSTRLNVELQPQWRNQVCGLCGNFDSNEMNDLQISGTGVSALAFGNNWKTPTPPCSDVTTDIYPCEHHSYCAVWAQRNCMIITGDIFKECHSKVDPEPYYDACVQEACSCDFKGKFEGFCTAVAAYAEACSHSSVCIRWRKPDLCPVFCDYYNDQGKCIWHYDPCGETKTCGSDFTHKLEGCYPRCPADTPYYDEHSGNCTKLSKCPCIINGVIIEPGEKVQIGTLMCPCVNGTIICLPPPPTLIPTTVPTTHENWANKTTPPLTTPSTTPPSTTPSCQCIDTKRKKSWLCGDTWIEDCFIKTCKDKKIELVPLECPEPTVPNCPRGRNITVTDECGCNKTMCDCRCEVYGDPHYITFQGLAFSFMENCTYVLMEEKLPQHHLTIAIDNVICMPGIRGSCAKGVILNYLNNTARLNIIPKLHRVEATLNNVLVNPPYEAHGLKFESTDYVVTIYIPGIRSFVSLTPSWTLVVNLAMEYFDGNTQGQCGVCNGPSCVRRDGTVEDDSCCNKTAYEWVYPDPLKPDCFSRNVPCNDSINEPPCDILPPSPLCNLFFHNVFSECSKVVDMAVKKRNCEYDSCRNVTCPSLEQAAQECKGHGFCIEWRGLTNGVCDVTCEGGLVYKECPVMGDNFCSCGEPKKGKLLKDNDPGCFCPRGQFRAGEHSQICVANCSYCEWPLGGIKWPGDVWESNCQLCTCDSQTLKVNCVPKPLQPSPICNPGEVWANTSCYGEVICVEKTCSYLGKTYKVGESWSTSPCVSFHCTEEGLQTETRVCPEENCLEVDKIWDEEHCCFTCKKICAPKVSTMTVNIEGCISTIQMLVCDGYCMSKHRLVVNSDLQVAQMCQCCQERSTERRLMTLQCSDGTFRRHTYEHIISCDCRECP